MKKRLIFALAIFVFLSAAYLLLKPAITGSLIVDVPEENAELSVYFCPDDDCLGAVTDAVKNSNSSIHCAFYDTGNAVLGALSEKYSEGADVKLVLDDDSKDIAPFAKKENMSGLMHNKFCIFDVKTVLTGSFNPTEGGARDRNNIVMIKSRILAENYEAEFGELWNGNFGEGEKVKNPKVMLNRRLIENYFCPEDECSEKIIKEIRKANSSIYFMLFSFTHPKIATELVLKQKEGVEIKGIMEKSQTSRYSKYELLKYQGIDVRWDESSRLMHNKVFVINNSTVITGSFNPTENADERNDENILIIHDEDVAKEYLEEFEKLWG